MSFGYQIMVQRTTLPANRPRYIRLGRNPSGKGKRFDWGRQGDESERDMAICGLQHLRFCRAVSRGLGKKDVEGVSSNPSKSLLSVNTNRSGVCRPGKTTRDLIATKPRPTPGIHSDVGAGQACADLADTTPATAGGKRAFSGTTPVTAGGNPEHSDTTAETAGG